MYAKNQVHVCMLQNKWSIWEKNENSFRIHSLLYPYNGAHKCFTGIFFSGKCSNFFKKPPSRFAFECGIVCILLAILSIAGVLSSLYLFVLIVHSAFQYLFLRNRTHYINAWFTSEKMFWHYSKSRIMCCRQNIKEIFCSFPCSIFLPSISIAGECSVLNFVNLVRLL